MSNEISITYCVPCGYERRARAAADQLKAELGIEPTLIPGTGGVFKVSKGDQVLARRTREHFPDTTEIVQVVAEAVKPA